MFDRVFDHCKSQFEDWVKSGVEQLGEKKIDFGNDKLSNLRFLVITKLHYQQ